MPVSTAGVLVFPFLMICSITSSNLMNRNRSTAKISQALWSIGNDNTKSTKSQGRSDGPFKAPPTNSQVKGTSVSDVHTVIFIFNNLFVYLFQWRIEYKSHWKVQVKVVLVQVHCHP